MAGSPLEDLLRSCQMERGQIVLTCLEGEWGATIAHQYGPMVHPMMRWRDDPVDALRSALVEDSRIEKDASRRYAIAPRFGTSAGIPPDEKKKFPTGPESVISGTQQEQLALLDDDDDFGDLL
ncbi:hypothetical protein I5E68_09830 [Novosphingobium sp. YJ-S2-02]|uniref:Uncharacterized protein n=1 Tax=Novosphingobium aureum TaxID=2792964 RepID=A0A931ML91_9SPHN|nr:hypothetical protein [Novosphingobium aureum]MBH0113244.1 hypothetical protein [Novosphingobium aureum]